MKNLALTTLAIAVLITSCGEKEETEERPKQLLNVEVEKVDRQDFEHWVEVQGAVETQDDMFISAEMGGKIRSINVEEGDVVRRGEVLAVIDSDIISKNIEELKTNLELAEYVFEKQKNLREKGIGSELEYKQALNQVKTLEKKLETLKAQAGKAVVVAPTAGVIETVFPNVGEMAGPQAPLIRMLNMDNLKVSAYVSEAYLMSIQKGSKVKVEFPSIDVSIDSLEINKTGKFIQEKNRTYKITINLGDRAPENIIPNLVARVYVRSEVAENALVVPRRSLMFDKNGNTNVYRLEKRDTSNYAVKVAVDKIFSFGGFTAVESKDLSEGNLVITTGVEGVEDGSQVELLKEE